MISKKERINYSNFQLDQFRFREEKGFDNAFDSLYRKAIGTEWGTSPFRKVTGREWLASPFTSKAGQLLTLQNIGNALGLDNFRELLIYHQKRLLLHSSVSRFILSLFALPILPILFISIAKSMTFSIFLSALSIVVLLIFEIVYFRIVGRIVEFMTFGFFSDSLSIQRSMWIILELARCQNPLAPFQKKRLLVHITFLEKVTRSLANQFNPSAKTLDWARGHLSQIESFLQEREKWIIAPRETTLEDLQQDFYSLAVMYISGDLGVFEYEPTVGTTEDKPSTNIRGFLLEIARVALALLIPILGLVIIGVRPDMVTKYIEIKVLTLICIGWFLLAIDAILKLGIVAGAIGIAKGIKDLGGYKRPTQRAADLVVRAVLESLSRRGGFFRFGSWFSHQAANASR